MDEKCFISRTHIIILTYHRTCHLSKTQSSDTPHTVLSVPNPNPMRTQKSQIFLRFPYLVHQPGPTIATCPHPIVPSNDYPSPLPCDQLFFFSLIHALLWTQENFTFLLLPNYVSLDPNTKKKNSKTLEFFSLIYSLLIATLRKLESLSFSPRSVVFQSGVYLFFLFFFGSSIGVLCCKNIGFGLNSCYLIQICAFWINGYLDLMLGFVKIDVFVCGSSRSHSCSYGFVLNQCFLIQSFRRSRWDSRRFIFYFDEKRCRIYMGILI